LSLALAEKGLCVTGVDATAELLTDARRGAQVRGLAVNFEERDMRDLPWTAEFDGAFCMGNSFGYFDDAGNFDFLDAVARILKPGGKFVLETHFAAECVFSQISRQRWFELGDVLCLHDTQYDPLTATLTSTYRMVRGKEWEEAKRAVYQIYLCRDLLGMLKKAGFSQIEAYGSLQREPFQIGSAGLWLVASRSA
jgi:ubiquinone/menaquinone biosynthesis C-methylase UbiE